MSMEAFGKALGIDIKPVQEEPQWIPETREQLLAITEKPSIPQPVWNVAGGGLDDHQLNLTNMAIQKTAKLMRARMTHIRRDFNQLDMPLTYATYVIEDWVESPKRAAERSLLLRFIRSQSGQRNWETPNNPLPVDFDYNRDVALARGHLHTGTMWAALKEQASPPPGVNRYGYVLPITPQERALSEEAAKVRFAEQQLPLAQRAAAVHNPDTVPYALYPHLATQERPGLSVTYIALADYVDKEAQKAWTLANKQIGQEAIIAGRVVAEEWRVMAATMREKWGRGGASPLYKLDQEAQKSSANPMARWWETHKAQEAAWIKAARGFVHSFRDPDKQDGQRRRSQRRDVQYERHPVAPGHVEDPAGQDRTRGRTDGGRDH